MKILLVEDDAGVGRFVSRGLAAEGNDVEWARSGAEARELIRDEAYSAAIVDLGLPDIDGMAFCRDLREGGFDVPICILTARASLEDKLEGFANGADDYLSKPFEFEELLARLNAIVRRREAALGTQIAVGSLTIDVRARRAMIDGQEIMLSRREYDVLLSLARDAGQPVGREAIRSRAWGSGNDITDNAVDVYVGYLRRTLASFANAPRIRTIRGQGFQLEVAQA